MFELPKSEFWNFSLSVYKQGAVSEVCLELQDDYGADINMMLFACWLGYSGRGVISTSAWRAMILRTAKWRDKVIRPLRSVRRFLKDEQLAPHSMKDNILKCEFDAEHIEQLILEKEWGTGRHAAEKDILPRVQDMADNLYSYFIAEEIELDAQLDTRTERLLGLISGFGEEKALHETVMQAQSGLAAGSQVS